MAFKRARGSKGRVVTLQHVSQLLRGNPLGDPHARLLDVWLPPHYDEGAGRGRGRRFPVLFDLVGYTGSGKSHTNWRGFEENVPERAARLLEQERMEPCIIVFPDCFTALGGNQYVNSQRAGPICGLHHSRTRSLRRSRVSHTRFARAPGLFRKVLGRLRRHHPRDEIRKILGRGRQPFG